MTIAKLEYRDHIPHGWIAVEFCYLTFSGDNKEELEKQWHEIEYAKCQSSEERLKEIYDKSLELQKLCIEYEKLQWYEYFAKRDKSVEIKYITNQLRNFALEDLNKLEEDNFFTTTVLISKAKKFLNNQGFVLDSQSSSSKECVKDVEIWKKGLV